MLVRTYADKGARLRVRVVHPPRIALARAVNYVNAGTVEPPARLHWTF